MVLFNRCFTTGFLVLNLLALNACSRDLQNKLAADPSLKNSPDTNETPLEEKPTPTPSPQEKDFPEEIPTYPKAKLIETKAAGKGTLTRWQSEDSRNLITSFYKEEFQDNDWEVISPGEDDSPLVASKNGLEVRISLVNPTDKEEGEKITEFLVEHKKKVTSPQTKKVKKQAQSFSDLDKVDPQLTEYIKDLAQLGVFTLSSSKNKDEQFQPSQPITRRDYARWLVEANNLLYQDVPSKQIRLIKDAQQPAFKDVTKSDPDFATIQGLAEAGLIPSSLTGNTNTGLFRPDVPLTREDLVWWKVPLDTRQALPKATLDSIKETWGFQDASKVNPQVLPALYLDFQNGEQANIRRAFGYTTIFQPKKTVTRAEAAATLWYFGFQGEGITAKSVIDNN